MSYSVLYAEAEYPHELTILKSDLETRGEALEDARRRRLRELNTYGNSHADKFFIARDLEEVQP